MSFTSINPNDGKMVAAFPELSARQLDGKLAAAATAYANWKDLTSSARAVIVARAAALMRSDVDRFAVHATTEMGKLIGEARAEVRFSAAILDHYAKHPERYLAAVSLDPIRGDRRKKSDPSGIACCIEPWNFPYADLARAAGSQLMAGNVLVVRPAESVPSCAIEFERLWVEAGAPTGLYTNLFVSQAQFDKVVDDGRVAAVAMIGCSPACNATAALQGQELKPTSIQLNRTEAFIVLEDADLTKAIPWVLSGQMYNQGQTCRAAKRFIVVDAIADRFLATYQTAVEALRPGNPMDESTTEGPVCSEAALARLLGQVNAAVSDGAKVLVGGRRMDRAGSFMQATMLTEVAPDNPAFREVFFGPVAIFCRVENEDAAVNLANDSDAALTGAVFAADNARALRLASRIDTGIEFVDNMEWADAELLELPGLREATRAADHLNDDGGYDGCRFSTHPKHPHAWSVLFSLPEPDQRIGCWNGSYHPSAAMRGDETDYALPGAHASVRAGDRPGDLVPLNPAPYLGPVPVRRRDGGPQFDRADVPGAAEENILGREFETSARMSSTA